MTWDSWDISEAWAPGPNGYAWVTLRNAPWRLVWRKAEGTTWLIEWTFGGETAVVEGEVIDE